MSIAEDLTGKKFGEWEVLYRSPNNGRNVMWHCLCHGCGTEKDVNAKSLRNGTSKSCGCGKENKENLIGQVFGNLTVLSQEKNVCRCQCSCKNKSIIEVSVRELKNGRRKSCGCLKSTGEDLVGQRFGRLVALRKERNEKGELGYICRCDCDGNEKWYRTYKLKSGILKSCGCRKFDFRGEDLSGKKFGVWEVLALGEKTSNGFKWKCRCEKCGMIKEILGSNLKKGLTSHCNCQKRGTLKDFTGQTIGNWTFLENVDTLRWKCRCKCGNERIVHYSNVIRGLSKSCGCEDIIHNGSQPENEIKDYILTLNSDLDVCKSRILDGKEIDIYLPDYNLGIEYNGSVYHASVNGLRGNKDIYYHQDKFTCAKDLGIHLINIFDVDWENNKDKIKLYIKDLIVKPQRIFARKCEIRKIEKDDSVSFVNMYHLQGANKQNMNINYGLYYNKELVSVMSFGNIRMKSSIDGKYEICRYCIKSGYNIIGGAEKLFNKFVDEYNPKIILSYSDNDYFNGSVYERLGFNFDGYTVPSYYWYLNGNKISREKCQPRILKEKYPELYDSTAKSVENDIMIKLGAMKVYRCGNSRWIYRKEE